MSVLSQTIHRLLTKERWEIRSHEADNPDVIRRREAANRYGFCSSGRRYGESGHCRRLAIRSRVRRKHNIHPVVFRIIGLIGKRARTVAIDSVAAVFTIGQRPQRRVVKTRPGKIDRTG